MRSTVGSVTVLSVIRFPSKDPAKSFSLIANPIISVAPSDRVPTFAESDKVSELDTMDANLPIFNDD